MVFSTDSFHFLSLFLVCLFDTRFIIFLHSFLAVQLVFLILQYVTLSVYSAVILGLISLPLHHTFPAFFGTLMSRLRYVTLRLIHVVSYFFKQKRKETAAFIFFAALQQDMFAFGAHGMKLHPSRQLKPDQRHGEGEVEATQESHSSACAEQRIVPPGPCRGGIS
jgi:hypothetical protein